MLEFKNKTYSFEDEICTSFYYSEFKKTIHIEFESFYENDSYINNTCILKIQNWNNAKSSVYNSKVFKDLEKNLGIFSMILGINKDDFKLNIVANTIDDRYIELYFEQADIYLEFKSIKDG